MNKTTLTPGEVNLLRTAADCLHEYGHDSLSDGLHRIVARASTHPLPTSDREKCLRDALKTILRYGEVANTDISTTILNMRAVAAAALNSYVLEGGSKT